LPTLASTLKTKAAAKQQAWYSMQHTIAWGCGRLLAQAQGISVTQAHQRSSVAVARTEKQFEQKTTGENTASESANILHRSCL